MFATSSTSEEKKDGLSDSSERARVFAEAEVRSRTVSGAIHFKPEDAELRRSLVSAEVKAFLERKWPGFFSTSVSTVPSLPPKVCPDTVVVEDEGQQSSDEDDDMEDLDLGEQEED